MTGFMEHGQTGCDGLPVILIFFVQTGYPPVRLRAQTAFGHLNKLACSYFNKDIRAVFKRIHAVFKTILFP